MVATSLLFIFTCFVNANFPLTTFAAAGYECEFDSPFLKFMTTSLPHLIPNGSVIILLIYIYQTCKDERWISIAKYLKEDVPRLVSSQHVDTVEKILSVVFKSLPSKFNQFIRWVAEIRITEDVNQHLSAEEKSRLNLKVLSV